MMVEKVLISPMNHSPMVISVYIHENDKSGNQIIEI